MHPVQDFDRLSGNAHERVGHVVRIGAILPSVVERHLVRMLSTEGHPATTAESTAGTAVDAATSLSTEDGLPC
jgi:hypothetical protein